MDEAQFEELELHVLTLAFQIDGLKKSSLTSEEQASLNVLEEDYRHYKKRYDQTVSKMEKPVATEESFGDW